MGRSWERWISIAPQIWAEDELVARALGVLQIFDGDPTAHGQSCFSGPTHTTNSLSNPATALRATSRPTNSLQHGRGRRELSSRRPPFPIAEAKPM